MTATDRRTRGAVLNGEAEQAGLAGKVALVTGAGRGLGEAIARMLASAGSTVVPADVRGDLVEKLALALEPVRFTLPPRSGRRSWTRGHPAAAQEHVQRAALPETPAPLQGTHPAASASALLRDPAVAGRRSRGRGTQTQGCGVCRRRAMGTADSAFLRPQAARDFPPVLSSRRNDCDLRPHTASLGLLAPVRRRAVPRVVRVSRATFLPGNHSGEGSASEPERESVRGSGPAECSTGAVSGSGRRDRASTHAR